MAIAAGRIAAIGALPAAKAARTIDATGKFLTPGFIDIHSHSDRGLGDMNLRYNINMVAQGITLSVVNQDGRSPWPIRDQKARYEKQGVGSNVALMVGHGTVRNRVMGARANQLATDADITAMQALVDEGMKDGAYGLSTGLEYVPGRFSETREVVELTRPVKPYGGFYISHERSEGRDPMWNVKSDPTPYVDLIDAVKETITIGRETGVPVICSHLKAKGADFWGASHAATRLIREAREQGIEVYADQYPYDTSGSDGSTVLIPRWALAPPGTDVGDQLGEGGGGRGDRRQRESQPRSQAEERCRRREDPDDIAHEIDPPRRRVARRRLRLSRQEVRGEEHRVDREGPRPLTGRCRHLDSDERLRQRPAARACAAISLSEIDLDHIMQQDFTATCTDGDTVEFGQGVPHARFYGTMPRKIRKYSMDRGIIGLPLAIRSMTSLPAQIMGLKDRGSSGPATGPIWSSSTRRSPTTPRSPSRINTRPASRSSS